MYLFSKSCPAQHRQVKSRCIGFAWQYHIQLVVYEGIVLSIYETCQQILRRIYDLETRYLQRICIIFDPLKLQIRKRIRKIMSALNNVAYF
jgi:hypothetical protein